MNGDDVVRVLQVVGRLEMGGTQTWLLQVLRHIDRERFKMDVLVPTAERDHYHDELRALGCRIIPLLSPRRLWTHVQEFRRIALEYGPYDILHAHIGPTSGLTALLARSAGIPVRIVHSRNLREGREVPIRRRLLRPLMCYLIDRHATHLLAISRAAAIGLFGARSLSDPRFRIVTTGIELQPFRTPVDREKVRKALAIPLEATVVGHVGRFVQQKNHEFLVDVAARVLEERPDTWFLLVGDGPLRSGIQANVQQLGLADRFVFAGIRSDVIELMKGAMDVFLFPSLWEGLGRALVEAQAAGLPCVIADVIPDEADVVKPLVQRLSLAQSASIWAEATRAATETEPAISQSEALSILEQSPLNIEEVVKGLEQLYDACARTDANAATGAARAE